MKKSTLFGTIVTVVWLLGAVGFLWYRWPAEGMKPNEIGDYIAGFVSPLAFLWLVLGYRQQGEELALNTEALRLQVEELKHSVAAQNALSETAREDLATVKAVNARAERERVLRRQPRLIFLLSSYTTTDAYWVFNFILENLGVDCSNVLLRAEPHTLQVNQTQWPKVTKSGGQNVIQVVVYPGGPIPSRVKLTFEYDDADGERMTAIGWWRFTFEAGSRQWDVKIENPKPVVADGSLSVAPSLSN